MSERQRNPDWQGPYGGGVLVGYVGAIGVFGDRPWLLAAALTVQVFALGPAVLRRSLRRVTQRARRRIVAGDGVLADREPR